MAHSRTPMALIIAVLMTASARAEYLLSPDKMQIVLVGSSDSERKDYIDAANMTVAKMFRTHFFTDVSLPACKVCFEEQHLQPGTIYRGAWATEIWSSHGRKWWCAQNRPIQILQRLLPTLYQSRSLPEYLFVGDDDTWINPNRLVQQYHRLNSSTDLFIGYAHPHHQYPWGGAGYFVQKLLLLALLHAPDMQEAEALVEASTAAHQQMVEQHIATVAPHSVPERDVLDRVLGPGVLQEHLRRVWTMKTVEAQSKHAVAAAAAVLPGLARRVLGVQAGQARQQPQQPQQQHPNWLDICLQLKMGGRWCLWHSDWVIAECIKLASGVRPDVSGEAMGLSYNSCRPDTQDDFTTCHHVPAAHYKALYAHLLANDGALRTLVLQSNSSLLLNN